MSMAMGGRMASCIGSSGTTPFSLRFTGRGAALLSCNFRDRRATGEKLSGKLWDSLGIRDIVESLDYSKRVFGVNGLLRTVAWRGSC
jgi:hypothetical protein